MDVSIINTLEIEKELEDLWSRHQRANHDARDKWDLAWAAIKHFLQEE